MTRELYDLEGLVTDSYTTAVKAIYTVKTLQRIDGYSFASAMIQATSTSAMITISTPQELGNMSSAPLDGYFVINCPDPANSAVIYSTSDIGPWESVEVIQLRIDDKIPYLASKVTVRELPSEDDEDYWQNQVNFLILFRDVEFDVPQCFLSKSDSIPLTGNEVVFVETTVREYGDNLFFQPVPLEMLYTSATKPQVLVTVDGMPALCANLNCDFVYEETTSVIDS